MATFGSRLKHAWNAFINQQFATSSYDNGAGYSYRPDRTRLTYLNERSIISSIYARLSIDVASIEIRHVRLDKDNRYKEDIPSGLNNCLTVEANMDQAARHFRQDVVTTLLDRGSVAIVPVDTTIDPSVSGSFDIQSMRVGEIVGWYPRHVRLRVYNEAKGFREEITLEKKYVALVENPLYIAMNEPNSTLQRLIRKLTMLDAVDEQSSSGKLDLIVQLPYAIKSDARRQAAEQRRKDMEFQLSGNKYGIAYTDATEKITQLNRPVENNLLAQVQYLTTMLYGQLGLTEEIMNGTADEKTMLNYMNRTVEPILTAIIEAMKRTFLTKTARSQQQSIMYFQDRFRLVPIENMAQIADKFMRNEVMSANEFRQAIGMKPSSDPNADKLKNANMPAWKQASAPPNGAAGPPAPPHASIPAPSGPMRIPQRTTPGGGRQNGS